MIFFHLSDLHLGLKLLNHDLLEDEEIILAQIVAFASKYQPDAVIIAGDIYDRAVPQTEAVEALDRFVISLAEAVPKTEIMMISGNHDSAPRLDLFRQILQRQRIHMIGKPPMLPGERITRVTLTDEYGEVDFYLLPFVKPSMVRAIVGTNADGTGLTYDESLRRLLAREKPDPTRRNVLVSHQFYLPVGADAEGIERMDSEIRTVGNIDEVRTDVLSCFDYAALGHIHKPMAVGSERYRYAGTPLACSVSEAGQQKGVVMVTMEGKSPEGEPETRAPLRIEILPLTPRRQVRILKGTLEEVLRQACDDYVSLILTDPAGTDMSDVQDRLRLSFPHLLEIRREGDRQADYGVQVHQEALADPYALCLAFLNDTDEEEKEILMDVINTVRGAGE